MRARPPAAAWSVDDASTFAPLKEFKLLQLLSSLHRCEGLYDGASSRHLLLKAAATAKDRKVWCNRCGYLGSPNL